MPQRSHKIDVSWAARRIGIPCREWPGYCTRISRRFLETGIVEGWPRLGHYTGPIHQDSMFMHFRPLGIVPHGWIELANGRVVDPTRFVFEKKRAYVYRGDGCQYDAGGEHWRCDLPTEPPAYRDGAPTFRVWNEITRHYLTVLAGSPPRLTEDHARWLASLPLGVLSVYARQLYETLDAHGLVDAIPIDQWALVKQPDSWRKAVYAASQARYGGG